MFKSLANFFKSTASEEDDEKTETTKEETPEKETPEEIPDDDDEPEDEPEEGKPAASVTGAGETKISTERFQQLVAAETELKKLGATPAARKAAYAEIKQLHAWYEAVTAMGIKGVKLDANQEEKGKKRRESSVTKEARAMQASK